MLDHFAERNVIGAVQEVPKFHSQLRFEDNDEIHAVSLGGSGPVEHLMKPESLPFLVFGTGDS